MGDVMRSDMVPRVFSFFSDFRAREKLVEHTITTVLASLEGPGSIARYHLETSRNLPKVSPHGSSYSGGARIVPLLAT